MITLQIANQNYPGCPSPQIGNPKICKEKSSVTDPDTHCFVSNILFYQRKYILIYDAMYCHVSANLKKLSPQICGFAI
jgi:hypothetical protein